MAFSNNSCLILPTRLLKSRITYKKNTPPEGGVLVSK